VVDIDGFRRVTALGTKLIPMLSRTDGEPHRHPDRLQSEP
jgi:hypothetical protein